MLFVRIVIIIYIQVSTTSTAPKAQRRRRCPGGWSCPTCSSRTPKFLRGPPLSTRMYSETCLYTCISRDMPHNPVSRDASHVFAERPTRGHNYLFQVPVNHRILHILHPRPESQYLPCQKARQTCHAPARPSGSRAFRQHSSPSRSGWSWQFCPHCGNGLWDQCPRRPRSRPAPRSPAEPAQGSPAGGSGGAAAFTKVEEVKEEGL